jgi:hypothetical protein
MEKAKSQKVLSFVGWLSALIAGTSAILTFVVWLINPHIVAYIKSVVKDDNAKTLKKELSIKMDVEEEEVDNEIAWMYGAILEFSSSHDGDNNKWGDYLEETSKWTPVGYFVSVEDKAVIKYHHQNGRNYDAWTEPATGQLYYIKDGFKYY